MTKAAPLRAAAITPAIGSTPALAIRRKCACGGSAGLSGECEDCRRKKLGVQRKLTVGASNDPLEHEADRAADQVMSGGTAVADSGSLVRLQRFSPSAGGPAEAPASVARTLALPGQPLESGVRRDMEAGFGHDFSRVRVHTDAEAARSAADVDARAYATGDRIVFGAGHYVPGSTAGRHLLAHELAHVVQQSGAPSGTMPLTGAGTLVQRAPGPLASASIDELRKRAVAEPAAAEELWNRFWKMTNVELERYARNDPMAQSIYAQRGVTAKAAAGQGGFSRPAIEGPLTDALARARAAGPKRSTKTPVMPDAETEGGTMGVARSDIPGLEDTTFVGKSPRAGGAYNPASQFGPATEYDKLPQTHAHAEQDIADQLDARLKSIPREKLVGRRVWMLIEQEPCSTCAQGVADPKMAAGVLKKLADAYPELTFEIKNLNTSGRIVIEARAAPAGSPGSAPKTPSAQAPGPKAAPPQPAPPSAGKTPEVAPPEAETPKAAAPKAPVPEMPAPKPPVPQTPVPEAAAPKAAPPEIPTPKVTVPEAATPKAAVPEGVGPAKAAPGSRTTPRLAPRLGSAAAGVALGVFSIGMMLADLVIQLVIVPYLESLKRKLEEAQQKHLHKQVQDYYDKWLQADVDRALYCSLAPLRALEAAGKQAHVGVSLRVYFGDLSNRLFDSTPPESAFDLMFHSVAINMVSVDEKEPPKSSTPLKKSEKEGWSVLGGTYTLFEQDLRFSFPAPPSAEIAAQFGDGKPPPSCGCFIATACWGTPFAREVMLLRRFRDRTLQRSRGGRRLVALYYALSPQVARWLERRPRARRALRERVLGPLVGLMLRRRWVEGNFPAGYPTRIDLGLPSGTCDPALPARDRMRDLRHRRARLDAQRHVFAQPRKPSP